VIIKEILEDVLNSIKPSEEEISKAYELYEELSAIIRERLKIRERFKVELEGSLAKGTALKDNLELDVFVLIDREDINRAWLKENFIEPLESALMDKFTVTLRFASHPYLRVKKGDIEADIVPAYWAEDIRNIKTPVDRTPFHTKYVISKLNERQKDEVRLLKKFFKGLGIYGAEIKVEGFSGYLSEVLIIKYGDFLNALRGMVKWNHGSVIVVEEGVGDIKTLKTIFRGSPLIVPDPVDPGRNAAAAVSKKSLTTAIVGASMFMECPSKSFFFPQKQAMNLEKIEKALRETSREVLLLTYRVGNSTSPDILWGELKRISRKIRSTLKEKGFTIVDSSLWSDEKSTAILLIELLLPAGGMPKYEIRKGPPILRSDYMRSFLFKHIKRERPKETFIGPWISDEGILKLLVHRKYVDPLTFLKSLPRTEIETKDLKLMEVGGLEIIERVLREEKALEKILYWLTDVVVKRPSWMGACSSR